MEKGVWRFVTAVKREEMVNTPRTKSDELDELDVGT